MNKAQTPVLIHIYNTTVVKIALHIFYLILSF
jgi:hypothetical protein